MRSPTKDLRDLVPPYMNNPGYRDCGNMALGLAEDGAVVLLAMAYAGDVQNTILGWRSTDAGQTWDRVDTAALAANTTGSVYGNILQVPGMGLVAFGHYYDRQPRIQGMHWVIQHVSNGRKTLPHTGRRPCWTRGPKENRMVLYAICFVTAFLTLGRPT